MSRVFSSIARVAAGVVALCAGWAYYVNRRRPDVDIVLPAPLEGNAIDEMLAVAERLQSVLALYYSEQGFEFEPEKLTLQQRETLLSECRPLLEQAHAAASSPLRFPQEREPAMFATCASGARNFAKALSTCAVCFRLNGDADQAGSLALDIVETGRKLPHHSALIHGLVGIALESIGYVQLEEAIPDMTAEGLRGAEERLESIDEDIVPFEEFILREGYWLADLRQSEFRRGGALSRMWRSLCVPFEGFWEVPGLWWLPESLKDGLKLLFTDKDRYIRDILECHRRVADAGSGTYDGQGAWEDGGVAGVYAGDLLNSRRAFVKRDAVSALQRARIAVYRYRLAHGAFPERLEDVVPEFLHAVPADPFGGASGSPLLYRKESDGLVLYSRGPNRKDDGGQWASWQQLYWGGDMVAGRIFERSPDDLRPGQLS